MLYELGSRLREINPALEGTVQELELAPGFYAARFNLHSALTFMRRADGTPIWRLRLYPISDAQRARYEETGNLRHMLLRCEYGVADDLDQIRAYFKPEITDTQRLFIVGCTPVYRNPSNPGSGWRWHKWGPYIGTHESKAEYLNDEPEIESVLVYHLYEIQELTTEERCAQS